MPLLVLLTILCTSLFAQRGQDSTAPRFPISGPRLNAPTAQQSYAGVRRPIQMTSGSSWIDTSSRSTVKDSYLNVYLPTSAVPVGWNGDFANGDAGSTSRAYRDAVLLRVNWFRQMAGVPTPIVFSSTYNSEDQQAAMMVSANSQTSSTIFTGAAADAAAHSNLCLNLPYLNDPGCVAQYMQDYGMTNPQVGHRRWLLYPQTQTMGTGDVQPPYPLGFANALWVIDTHFYDARPTTRETYVAWPPKGFIPYQIVPGRWSFSYPGADFSNASVTMQRSGGPVSVRMEAPQPNYGENTLVWVPDNIDTDISTHWPAPQQDTPVTVTVSHVTVAGVDTAFSYTVTIFDPTNSIAVSGHITKQGTGVPGVVVQTNTGLTITTDNNGAYSFPTLPSGSYTITPTLAGFGFSPPSQTVSGSTTTADFTLSACDYSGINGNYSTSAASGTGTYSYALAAGCPWTAASNVPWLVINPATLSGSGPILVGYSYTLNHGTPRAATITIAPPH